MPSIQPKLLLIIILNYVSQGTDVVEGIFFNLHQLNGDLYLGFDSLGKITNMRFLRIYDWQCKLNLPNDLESLSNKLRYLEWIGCSLESLPPNFCVEHLVEL